MMCQPAGKYFYPRSPCGERHGRINDISRLMKISIHALLAESDLKDSAPALLPAAFLSTLSLRRATACIGGIVDNVGFLSTLSLRRATSLGDLFQCQDTISIHALLAESDGGLWMSPGGFWAFLSTLSLRRATSSADEFMRFNAIFLSTLSLRRATACSLKR